jgi:hypothetical protein
MPDRKHQDVAKKDQAGKRRDRDGGGAPARNDKPEIGQDIGAGQTGGQHQRHGLNRGPDQDGDRESGGVVNRVNRREGKK